MVTVNRMKIGTVKLDGNVFLAPMAGVTDRAFRMITKPFGPSLMYTEMVSGKGLLYHNKRTEDLLEVSDAEKPVAAQIFGHEPSVMAAIAEGALRYGACMIDINMGCPAPKIVSNGDGCALMRTPALAGEIIRAVTDAVDVPVTVKLRKGWDDDSVNVIELARIAEQNGAAAVTVHGRTRMQFYSGSADLDSIRAVVSAVQIPVIGNGDITDGPTARHMLAYTGCAGVMVGRAAQGNPWIFQQIRRYLEQGEAMPLPSLAARLQTANAHIQLLVQCKGERRGIQEGRKHLSWYLKGLPGGPKLRDQINRACTLDEMQAILDSCRQADETCEQ